MAKIMSLLSVRPTAMEKALQLSERMCCSYLWVQTGQTLVQPDSL